MTIRTTIRETVRATNSLVTGGGVYTGPQIVVVGYGQSNWLMHLTTTSSPDAAAEGTYYFDPTGGEWTTSVPNGNGVRKLLNALQAATGKTVGIVSAGVSGVNIAYLMEGAGNPDAYDTLASRIAASGCRNAEELFIAWHQGEGNANTASPDGATYKSNLDTLHQSIVDEVGRTKAQMPLFCSSLATVTGGSFTNPDSSWATIQAALVTANDSYPNIHYSHSNLDATLADGVHWDAASYGRSGERYARKILQVRGDVATEPNWTIASAAIVDATHTDITVTHSMGTDFTPTSGITGFAISNDNWATSATISAAVRQSATVIRLTHADLGTVADRLVRYGWGKTPDMSAPVLDNGSINAPLNHTSSQVITAEGSGALPVPTLGLAFNMTGSPGTTQTFTAQNLGDASTSEELLLIIAGTVQTNATTGPLSSVTITPNGGSPISPERTPTVYSGISTVFFAQFVIPAGSDLSDVDGSITFAASLFADVRAWAFTVPTGDLSSLAPVDADSAAATSTTTQTVNLSTSTGGFLIALASSNNASSNAGSWSGDEPPAEVTGEATHSGAQKTAASASDTAAATNDNAITVTFTQSGNVRLAAMSWR